MDVTQVEDGTEAPLQDTIEETITLLPAPEEDFTEPSVEVHQTDLIIPPNQRFLNRELSWLAFNQRVLEQAESPRTPLLERVKFLAISDTNLDEFTAVRVATLKTRLEAGVGTITPDGLGLSQQLDLVSQETEDLLLEQQRVWTQLKSELGGVGINIIQPEELMQDETEWLQGFVSREILPVLTPLACDPAHPFPFIPSDGLCLALKVKDTKAVWIMLPLPSSLPRFIKLAPAPRKDRTVDASRYSESRYLPLEKAIPLFFDRLLPNFKVKRHGVFHLLRDSEVTWESKGKGPTDLTEIYLSALKRRKRGAVVRLTFEAGFAEDLREFITTQADAESEDVFEMEGLLNLSDISQLYAEERPELKYPHHEVRFPERVKDYGGDYFTAISSKDIVVHHPYESFDVVVEFLRQAARDPDVIAIKQTLYRTGKISSIVRALVEAAEAGKSVTVVVELKARFDEEANIRLANDLERAGAHVVYGFVDFKTHAKMSLVLRRESKGLKGYMHFGTGNYHPITARFYTDLSFFTCDEALLRDAAKVFNYLTGYAVPSHLEKLVVAPLNMKKSLLDMIEAEIHHVAEGRPGQIWAKMNALVDPEIINALYRASQAGVEIALVVRGICCLRPGIAGFSENIRVKSIVGRFLEHARVVCFGNGKRLPHKRAKVFISSADWMPRNLLSRVETMVPVETDSVHAQLLDQVMIANLKDTRNSWILQSDGTYLRHPDQDGFSAHEHFLKNESLSGRSRVRKKSKLISELSLS